MSMQFSDKEPHRSMLNSLCVHNQNYSNNDNAELITDSVEDTASMHIIDNSVDDIDGIATVCVNKLIEKYGLSLSLDELNDDKLVVNLSKFVLNEHHLSLLKKGLTFCPTPGKRDMSKIR